MRRRLAPLVIAVTALSFGCARASSTSPTPLEAVPLLGGTYDAVISDFTRIPAPQPSCPGVPADLTVRFSVTFEPSALSWIGRIHRPSEPDTGRIVLEPRAPKDAPAFSGVLGGAAFGGGLGSGAPFVAFGEDQVRVSGTLSASGAQASGTLGGFLAVAWPGSGYELNTCIALQATLTLTRVQ